MGDFDCCINCTDRTVTCHGDCEIYLEQKAKYNKKQEEIRKKRKSEQDVINIHDNMYRKMQKKHRRK